MKVKQLTASETLPIRHEVMWPNMPISYVMLPNDDIGKHFGLFVNDQLTSIVSVFVENNIAQFRKFATLTNFQGKGYGSFLLNYIIAKLKEDTIKMLWCNARVDKTVFYEKFDFKCTTKTYKKGGIDFVIMERFLIT